MEKERKELTSRISLEIVEDLAPNEVILFEDFKDEFLKNPDAFLERDKKKREKMLGFSIPAETGQFLTTLVLPLVYKTVKDHFQRKKKKEFSGLEITKLREEAYNNAILMGVDKEKAELMADALIGKIVRSSGVK